MSSIHLLRWLWALKAVVIGLIDLDLHQVFKEAGMKKDLYMQRKGRDEDKEVLLMQKHNSLKIC